MSQIEESPKDFSGTSSLEATCRANFVAIQLPKAPYDQKPRRFEPRAKHEGRGKVLQVHR